MCFRTSAAKAALDMKIFSSNSYQFILENAHHTYRRGDFMSLYIFYVGYMYKKAYSTYTIQDLNAYRK